MPTPREYDIEILGGHLLLRLGHAKALLDTGSPVTMRPPRIVEEQLGVPVRWLVGTDALRRHRLRVDWARRGLSVDPAHLTGESIPLTPLAGLFQVQLQGPQGPALAFLDSGAAVSYAPASAVSGLRPIAQVRDFYPLFGEFDVPVYEIAIRVGSRRIRGRFGVLPELLALLLGQVGGSGWILGADFFRDRVIDLDLANHRVIDVTPPEVRVTLPTGGESLVTPSERESGVRAWRGWRLVDEGGVPRLRSLTSHFDWDGPVASAITSPRLDSSEHAGLHAYRTPLGMRSLSHAAAVVYGEVTLFGDICAHERGYRAERARVDRLYLRACGRHAHSWTAGNAPQLALDDRRSPDHYCGCPSLAPDEWLSYEELVHTARLLADRYQCDVSIDLERLRVPEYACSAHRARRARERSRPRAVREMR